jgi:hypothetical protein
MRTMRVPSYWPSIRGIELTRRGSFARMSGFIRVTKGEAPNPTEEAWSTRGKFYLFCRICSL